MAGKTLSAICASLIEAGMAVSTPAVVVENASRPNEAHVVGTLGTLPGLLAERVMDGPALVLIGAVVGMAQVRAAAERLAA
jgi:siroheme synthase